MASSFRAAIEPTGQRAVETAGVIGNFTVRPTCAYFFANFFAMREAGMRRCPWDTPYPRTMKSGDLCVRPGMFPRRNRAPRVSRSLRSRTVAVNSYQMRCCSPASAQGRMQLAPRLGIVRAGIIRCNPKLGPGGADRNSRTIRRFHIERDRGERSIRSLPPLCVVVCVVTVSSLSMSGSIPTYRSVTPMGRRTRAVRR
jgi:hypothetical protein